MDWNLAIERNNAALKRIVAMLVAMAGLSAALASPLRGEVAAQSDAVGGDEASTNAPARPSDDGPPPPLRGRFNRTLPRRLHRAILRLLRPAESAMRRLIVIAARGLVVPPSPLRAARPKSPSIFLQKSRGTGTIVPRGVLTKPLRPSPRSIALPLFDRLKRPFERRPPLHVCEPRISYAGPFAKLSPVKIRRPPEPDDPLDATRLTLRIEALYVALDDLPKQAHRLARWRANRDAARDRGQFTFFPGQCAAASRQAPPEKSKLSPPLPRCLRRLSPLRPGRPPGFNSRLDADMRDMLTDLHGLAYDVLEHPDTS